MHSNLALMSLLSRFILSGSMSTSLNFAVPSMYVAALSKAATS